MGKTLKARFVLQDHYTRIIERMNRVTEKFERAENTASKQTDRFNSSIRKIGSTSTSAVNGISKMVKAFMGLQIVQAILNNIVSAMQVMDTYTNTLARLKLINNSEEQTPAQLNDKIFAAANRSRGSYGAMSESVARIGMLAGDKFSSNDELIGFTELVQKSFKLGGADTTEQQSAMLQLSQAMASGRLQGDEYISIIENAPLIADAIAKYTGVGREGLKELSSDGAITSEIIKNSVFSMANDINEQFKTIPKTWGDYMNLIQNQALRAFGKVFESISLLINTEGFQQFIEFIINGIYMIANTVSWLIEIITSGVTLISSFVSNHWEIISAILYAGLIVGVVLLVMWLWSVVPALWAMVPPALASAAAFVIMHAPILMVISIIAVLIYILNQMGVTASDVVGFVTGLFYMMGAKIQNQFILLHNGVIDFANFFHNVFKDPVNSVAILFLDLTNTVLGYIRNMAQAIENLLNSIPGIKVNITGGIDNIMNTVKSVSDTLKGQMGWEELFKKVDYVSLEDAATKGFRTGKDFTDSLGGKLKNLLNNSLLKGKENPYDNMDLSSKYGQNVPKVAPIKTPKTPKVQKVKGDGKNGAVKVEISEEDIRYLRDAAERDFVAKIQHKTLAPNIKINFTGPINKETDTDKMYKRITKILKQEIAMAGEA